MGKRVSLLFCFDSHDRLLLGRRIDNGKFSLPGGGADEDETPGKAAIRELLEETGLKPESLAFYDAQLNPDGTEIDVYSCNVGDQQPDASNDPDKEFDSFLWLDVSKGLPTSVYNNLHGPQNLYNVLKQVYPRRLEKREQELPDWVNDRPTIIVIRHGQTKFNVAHKEDEGEKSGERLRGWLDIPLDKEGLKQADDTAQELADVPMYPVMRTSDLSRAYVTASKVKAFHPDVKLEITKQLRPLDMGNMTGQSISEVIPYMLECIQNPDQEIEGSSETFRHYTERSVKLFREAMAEAMANPGKAVVLVGHSRTTRIMKGFIEGGATGELDLKPLLDKEDVVKTGRYMVIQWDGKKWHHVEENTDPLAKFALCDSCAFGHDPAYIEYSGLLKDLKEERFQRLIKEEGPEEEDEIDRLLKSPNPDERIQALKLTGVRPRHLLKAAQDESKTVRKVATDQMDSDTLMTYMRMKSPNPVHKASMTSRQIDSLRSNRNATDAHLLALYQNHKNDAVGIEHYIAGPYDNILAKTNPKLITPDFIRAVYKDDPNIIDWSENHNTPPDILKDIWEHKGSLAPLENANCPPELLREVIKGGGLGRSSINELLRRANLPEDVIQDVFNGKLFDQAAMSIIINGNKYFRANKPLVSKLLRSVPDNQDSLINDFVNADLVEPNDIDFVIDKCKNDAQILDAQILRNLAYRNKEQITSEAAQRLIDIAKTAHDVGLLDSVANLPSLSHQQKLEIVPFLTREGGSSLVSNFTKADITPDMLYRVAYSDVNPDRVLSVIKELDPSALHSLGDAYYKRYEKDPDGLSSVASQAEAWLAPIWSDETMNKILDRFPVHTIDGFMGYALGSSSKYQIRHHSLHHQINKFSPETLRRMYSLSPDNAALLRRTDLPSDVVLDKYHKLIKEIENQPENFHSFPVQDAVSSLIRGKDLPPEVFKHMIETGGPSVAHAVINDGKNLSPEIYHDIESKYPADENMLARMATNPSAPPDVVNRGLKAAHESLNAQTKIRNILMRNHQKVNPEILQNIYKNKGVHSDDVVKLIKENYPDYTHSDHVAVKMNTAKLRRLRDYITDHGVKDMSPEQLASTGLVTSNIGQAMAEAKTKALKEAAKFDEESNAKRQSFVKGKIDKAIEQAKAQYTAEAENLPWENDAQKQSYIKKKVQAATQQAAQQAKKEAKEQIGGADEATVQNFVKAKVQEAYENAKARWPEEEAIRLPNGNISAEKLQQAIDSAEPTHYNISHGTWDGVQRHSDEKSKVFRVNLSNEHVRKLKEAGVWEDFQKMAKPYLGAHPVTPTTIGWVRYTYGGAKKPVSQDVADRKAKALEYYKKLTNWKDFIRKRGEGYYNDLYSAHNLDESTESKFEAFKEALGENIKNYYPDVEAMKPFMELAEKAAPNIFGHAPELPKLEDAPLNTRLIHENNRIVKAFRAKNNFGDFTPEARELIKKWHKAHREAVDKMKDESDKPPLTFEGQKYKVHPFVEWARGLHSKGLIEGPEPFAFLRNLPKAKMNIPKVVDPTAGYFVDEVQSDFSKSNVKKAVAEAKKHYGEQAKNKVDRGEWSEEQGRQHIEQGMANAFEEANKKWPEDKYNKIKDIVFGKSHANKILFEAFAQHLRDNGKHTTPVHIHTIESRAPMSFYHDYNPGEQVPVHFKVSYEDIPKEYGFGPKTYGQLSTEKGTGNDKGPTPGTPIQGGIVRKFEEESGELLNKYIKPENFEKIAQATDPRAKILVTHVNQINEHPPELGHAVEAFKRLVDNEREVKPILMNPPYNYGVSRKLMFRAPIQNNKSQGKFMVKPYHEAIVHGVKDYQHFPIQGWAEMANQALYHAGGIGHLHQNVFVTEHDMGTGKGKEPVLTIHISPGFTPAIEAENTWASPLSKASLRKIAMMDFLTNNCDRNGGNLLINKNGKVLAIDNSRSFQYMSNPYYLARNKTHKDLNESGFPLNDNFADYHVGSAIDFLDPLKDPRTPEWKENENLAKKYGPAFDWWGKVSPKVRAEFEHQLESIKHPKLREHLRRNFNARADWLDERAKFGIENYEPSRDMFNYTVPQYRVHELTDEERKKAKGN